MAARIEVARKDAKTFVVTVNERTTTTHTVTLEPVYYDKLTGGKVTPEKLIEKSFEFLLERESNTSILSSFDLPLIGHYFPAYEKIIVKRL
jgi:hypothetical protein